MIFLIEKIKQMKNSNKNFKKFVFPTTNTQQDHTHLHTHLHKQTLNKTTNIKIILKKMKFIIRNKKLKLFQRFQLKYLSKYEDYNPLPIEDTIIKENSTEKKHKVFLSNYRVF